MAEPISAELGDVIAYLERRRANAATIAKRAPDLEPWAVDRRQQLEVVIDELRAGLHHGCAEVAGALNEGADNGQH
jgi:hypothetical protein